MPVSEATREYKRQWYRRNRERIAAKAHARYLAHRDEILAERRAKVEYHRAVKLLSRYGITIDEYDAMSEHQGHVCAICRQPCPSGMRLSVDHDHATARVRGLVCKPCNVGLGAFDDDPSRLLAAHHYINGHMLAVSA